MPRRVRQSWGGGIFHVMNRGVNHGRIFFDDRDRLEAGQLLNEIHARFGVETLAYCLMTNHFHLVLRLEDDHLSAAMQHFDGELARRVNSRVGRDGPLFRGRYHSIPVTTDPYLQFVVRYVHRNALDLPGVDAVERFRWSSMRAYLGLRRPAPFMNLEPVLSMWRNGHELLEFHRSPAGEQLAISGPADLSALVEHCVAVDALGRLDEERERTTMQAVSRTVHVLVADRLGHPAVSDWIASEYASSDALYSARSRARRRAASDRRLDAIVNRVVAAFAADLATCA